MKRPSQLATVFYLLLLSIPIAEAQNLATLQGYVRDTTGGVLPGVNVEIRNVDTGAVRKVSTDGTGFYTSPALLPGNYMITAVLDGFQTVVRENIVLLVGQTLDVPLTLGLGSLEVTITVASESPVVELSRSSVASFVSEEEILNLPIAGRNFTDFALLQPAVTIEPIRGGISIGGLKGISTGIKIDGAEFKSAFFGYSRGGEATGNDGVVVAQDTVKEFQVVASGYSPEYGRHGGGYLNVITKSGTNIFKGHAFFFFRNENLVSDLQPTPLDIARGKTGDEDEFEPKDFRRATWGVSVGGPIVTDKTHFFAAYDHVDRTDPYIADIRGRGQYDAVLQRFPSLLRGLEPNNDGIAAPDPVNGRTATGRFNRDLRNVVLFGKLSHQFNDANTLSVRYSYTDFERRSDLKADESLKIDTTSSFLASLVSVIGTQMVNELRFQYAADNLDRLANLEPGDIRSGIRIQTPSNGYFGKPWFLPIFVRERKVQVQDNFTLSSGNHDLKFGVDVQIDDLSEFFAGYYDGYYTFRTIDDFLANKDRRVVVYFADIDPPPAPNFDVQQTIVGLYAQDSWRPSSKLTVNYGLRWDGTFNPQDIEHAFEEGRRIPNDLNNWGPRVGFAYSPDDEGLSVLRGGFGLFYDRTPTLIFFNVVQNNGISPNIGYVTVSPGQPGHVPLGEPIDNANAPTGTRPGIGTVDPDFEDAQTWRGNLGYEREILPDWSASFDLTWMKSNNLQSTYDANTFEPTKDEFGRYVYPSGRPDPNYSAIMVRNDISRSDYIAGTFKISKRFSRGYQLRAHYTLARDRSNDDNERSAGSITLMNFRDPEYDYGYSLRDTRHRLVASGVVELPGDFLVSGIGTFRSGGRYHALDPDRDLVNHPGVDFSARAVVDGRLTQWFEFRGPSFKNVDLRVNKFFDIGKVRLEGILEIFNLFNWGNFRVATGGTQRYYLSDGVTLNPEWGVPARRFDSPTFGNQRQIQLGIRVQY
jgi:hypothetical protein